MVVKGDGELTFKALIDCFFENGDLSRIKGICYKEDNGVIINNPEA